jgi:hypothetical protein
MTEYLHTLLHIPRYKQQLLSIQIWRLHFSSSNVMQMARRNRWLYWNVTSHSAKLTSLFVMPHRSLMCDALLYYCNKALNRQVPSVTTPASRSRPLRRGLSPVAVPRFLLLSCKRHDFRWHERERERDVCSHFVYSFYLHFNKNFSG